jgi:hypothetical protein
MMIKKEKDYIKLKNLEFYFANCIMNNFNNQYGNPPEQVQQAQQAPDPASVNQVMSCPKRFVSF